MAKTKISEFSTTANNNSDINSINISEGCAPSGINDAIRELMRQLKEFQTGGAGDSVNSGGDFSVATNKFTVASASGNTSVAGTLGVTGAATLSSTLAVTGTTTLTGALVANGNATLGDASGDTVTIKGTPTLEVNPTLSGGTANGVLYLNGSKVATSGSALTFDGTNFGVGTTTPTVAVGAGIQAKNATFASFRATAGSGTGIDFSQDSSGNGYVYNRDSGGVIFGTANAEGMRLTSTGLGVGTSSPTQPLTVGGTGNILVSSGATFFSSGRLYIRAGSGQPLDFGANNTNSLMQLDSSGNLGLGVTPSAWGGSYKGFQVAATGVFASNGVNGTALAHNAYYDGTNDKYLTTGAASRVFQFNGGIRFDLAASGTAGDAITFTQAMTLSASGSWYLGNTGGGLSNSNSMSMQAPDGYAIFNHVNGTSSGVKYQYFAYNGTEIGSITQSGTTGVLYNITSDQRLKENIVDAPEFGGVIDSMQVRSYDWKADHTHQRAGFIAQELVTVAPEAVHQPVNPEEMMAVDYSKLVPMLVKELQSLRARVAALES